MTVDEIKSGIDDLIDTNATNFTDARKIRHINRAINKIERLMVKYEANSMPWDDPNYTDLPIGYLDIVANKKSYDLSEDENFANVLLVHKVYAKNESGTFQELEFVSQHDDAAQPSIKEDSTGSPTTYRQMGMNIMPMSVPDYESLGGLKVIFRRAIKRIDSSDTETEIGVPTVFHDYISLYAAYDYARAKTLSSRGDLAGELRIVEKDIEEIMTRQKVSANTILQLAFEDNR